MYLTCKSFEKISRIEKNNHFSFDVQVSQPNDQKSDKKKSTTQTQRLQAFYSTNTAEDRTMKKTKTSNTWLVKNKDA